MTELGVAVKHYTSHLGAQVNLESSQKCFFFFEEKIFEYILQEKFMNL